MKKIIEDIKVYSNGSVMKVFSTILTNPDFHSVFIYRIANFFHTINLDIIAKLFWYLNRILYSVDIDYRADLSGGFKIIHGIGLIVGAFVKTRGKVVVYQGVTLGGSNNKENMKNGILLKQPNIGNNTVIYCNSMLLGPLWIGNDVIIGAGSIVMKDIEDGQVCSAKQSYEVVDERN